MAIEAYIVAFDIQEAASGYVQKPTAKLGEKEGVTVGSSEFETAGSSLYLQAKSGVASCKLVEVLAESAAEAIEVVRQKFAQNAGGERAVVKPNTNFKLVT